MTKKIYVCDSQVLNDIQACQRKTHFVFDKNLIPVVTPDYFERGDLLHQMLATYFKMRRYRSRWAANNTTHAEVIESCVKVGKVAAVKMSLSYEDTTEVIETFRQYAVHIANNGWDRIVDVEKVGSKILFEDESLVILYEFKIDLIISLINCPILPIDHKSSKQRREPQQLSNQFMGYCWGLGVNNIIENKIGFQKTLKPEEKFNEHVLSYAPWALEEWREVAIYWIRKYLRESDIGFYPPNFTSCDKYSGCIFRRICAAPPDVRQFKLDQSFEKRANWDVGKENV